MDRNQKTLRFKMDGYTRVCLTLIAVLLTVLVVELWAQAPPMAGTAHAAEQFLNTAAQRDEMVRQQRITNQKLDQLIKLFKSGQAKFQVTGGEPATPGARSAATKKVK